MTWLATTSWEESGDTIRFCEFDFFLLSRLCLRLTLALSCRLDVGNVGGAIRGFLS
jgi:hypothetical protein